MSAAEEEEEERWPGKRTSGETTARRLEHFRSICREEKERIGKKVFAKEVPIWVTDRGVGQICRSPSSWGTA
jgi:hypothetical protein